MAMQQDGQGISCEVLCIAAPTPFYISQKVHVLHDSGSWCDCATLPYLLDCLILNKAIEVDSQQKLPQVGCTLTALQLVALQQCVQKICTPPEVCRQACNLVRVCCICVTAAIIPLQRDTFAKSNSS